MSECFVSCKFKVGQSVLVRDRTDDDWQGATVTGIGGGKPVCETSASTVSWIWKYVEIVGQVHHSLLFYIDTNISLVSYKEI